MTRQPDDKTRRTERGASRGLRAVVFWDEGSASHPLSPGSEVSVGRSDECDLVVADDSVSRRHAVLRGGPPATIEDLDSANGTRIGDEPLAPGARFPLVPSMIVELGDALLVVRASEAPPQVTAAVAVPRPHLDAAMARVMELVDVVAGAPIPLILLGETGVGKGATAEAIHRLGKQATGPLVRVNCAAFAESLLESELFGHERGAFTGAVQAKAGLLEAAHGGTLLLDEIGDLPLQTQAKLLHVLEHDEVLRVGALKPRPIRVRFIAATNRDLSALVADGGFRRDLFFRLNGTSITIPPLRERPSELAALANGFVREACDRMGRPPLEITEVALRLLQRYAWPGNVRELRNAMVRAALFARGDRIGVEHFDLPATAEPAPPTGALHREVRDLERRRIVEALRRSNDNLSATAKELGIARGTLRSRMKELGVRPDVGKKSSS